MLTTTEKPGDSAPTSDDTVSELPRNASSPSATSSLAASLREKAAQERDKAHRAGEAGQRAWEASHAISDRIPMGQPILVGHHSERRHRRDLARIDGHMRRSVEASKEAARHDDRAKALERAAVAAERDASGETASERDSIAQLGKMLGRLKKDVGATAVRCSCKSARSGVARAQYWITINGRGLDVWINATRIEIGTICSTFGRATFARFDSNAETYDRLASVIRQMTVGR